MTVQFARDPEAKIHEEGAIKLICAAFRSHESGLPEWIKNSSDAYARINAPSDERNILIFFKNKKRNESGIIACLDFVGMTTSDIENRFRIWADPEAAGGTLVINGIQGGHGNGGKCYMTQMFNDYSLIHTVKSNIGNRYGFISGSTIPGYFPDRIKGKDFKVTNVFEELAIALKEIDASNDILPESVKLLIPKLTGFTLVKGVDPKDKVPVKSLIESITNHPQMIATIQICNIFVIVDGKLITKTPLKLEEIQPLPDAKLPKKIPIPSSLIDPITNENIQTCNNGGADNAHLLLKTSNKSMRHGLKYRHCIMYRANNKIIGFKEIYGFAKSYYADRIYGDCVLDELENYKTNERRTLAESPLTRALEAWIREQIEEYAKEFVKLDKLRASQEQREELITVNNLLNEWKNQFLKDMGVGITGSGDGPGTPIKKKHLPNGIVAKIKLDLPYKAAGVNISFKPHLEFFDSEGNRVRSIPYRWNSSDWNVATVDDQILTITTHAPGDTEIWAETLSGDKISSNKVILRVEKIKSIRLDPPKLQIPAGQRRIVKAYATLQDGREIDDVYLMWEVNDPKVATVSSIGMVYGVSIGNTEVTAFDDNCMAALGTLVEICQSIGVGGGDGTAYPQILLSEIDDDPLNPGQSATFAPEEGTVCQRAQDFEANLWWINTAAPLARAFSDNDAGYGFKSKEWRVYHLERYIEALIKIKLNHAFMSGEELPFDTMEQTWREEASSIQFKVVAELKGFIDEGELPYEWAS
jgi:hypothetical protein